MIYIYCLAKWGSLKPVYHWLPKIFNFSPNLRRKSWLIGVWEVPIIFDKDYTKISKRFPIIIGIKLGLRFLTRNRYIGQD